MAKKKSTQSTKLSQLPSKKSKLIIPKNKNKHKSKKYINHQQQQSNEIQQIHVDDDNHSQNINNQSFDDQYSSDMSNSESDQSDNVSPIKPQNYAVKQMTFRQRRGTKMKILMDRKKQQEQDPFWAQHKGYFGDINLSDDQDQQDYVQSSSGKDQFDSDFGQTQSQHDSQLSQPDKKLLDDQDQQKQKQKKRRGELMKKINQLKQKQQKSKFQNKQHKSDNKPKKFKSQPKIQQLGNRYIHQIFTQQQLLGQAAHTQYYNWLSLKKLISIQTQKKDFTKKIKHLDGQKIIYHDRLNQNGCRQVTYQLHGIDINSLSDLTSIWQLK